MYDILVLGAGISGLSAAIHAAEKGLSVVILTKGAKPDGSSNYAQGGWITAYYWWLRSPYIGNTSYFYSVHYYGGLYSYAASNAIGLVPSFSI